MEKHKFTIPRISCGHCVATITNELKELDGVLQVNGDPQSKTIIVEAQASVSDAMIKAKLNEIGYPATS